MSLESEIQNLTAAVENLAFIIKQSAVIHGNRSGKTLQQIDKEEHDKNLYAPLRTDDEVKGVTVTQTEAPPAVSVPAVPIAAQSVQMPGLPTFAPPPVVVGSVSGVAQFTHGKAPFSDAKGLMDYLMKSYTELNTKKGAEYAAKIQDVMKTLGAGAVNEVTPDKYDALFAGVEALK